MARPRTDDRFADDPTCDCEDFERATDDPLDFECMCGHIEDEHARTGFFRRCKYAPEPKED